MAGKGKSLVWLDYLAAYETAWHGMVELDCPVTEDSGVTMKDMMASRFEDPEENLIKKDSLASLSSESKEIIDLIFNAPSEVLACFITPKYNKISKNKIKEYLIKEGWLEVTVSRCFKELKDLCSDFY